MSSMPALSVPKLVTPRFDTIVGLTDAVCRTHLTHEYAALAREPCGELSIRNCGISTIWIPWSPRI